MRELVAIPAPLQERLSDYRRRAGGIRQRKLAGDVRALSDMFTGLKPLRPGYLADRALRHAYVCYYLPVNYAKVRLVLRELKGFADLPAAPRVLDFGAGPGTASLAALDELDGPRLTLVDIVDEALDDAEFLLGRPVARAGSPPDGKFDLILASNVLAELGNPEPLLKLLEESLEPSGYFVLVEPAVPKTALRVMAWRDELAARGFRIAAPCLGAASCPMRRRPDLWCHQDLPWHPPAGVDALDRALGFDKASLKYAYLIVTREGRMRAGPGRWRVVSNLHRSKGKAWAWLCGAKEELVRAELLTRNRLPAFEHARRGDVLEISPEPAGRLDPSTGARTI
jgi:SAM-dependent methyltransferase